MADVLFHLAWSCNHVWHPSSRCRQRGVDACVLWESPKILILESGTYIPIRDLEALLNSFTLIP